MKQARLKIILKGVAFMCPFVFGLLLGCKNEEEIGLEIHPDGVNQRLEVIDTITLQAKNVVPDHIQTNRRVNELLGVISDAKFGESRAHTSTNFALSIDGASFEDDVVLDSAVLSLVVNGEYLIESNSRTQHTIEVYELDQDLSGDSIYYSDTEPLIKSEVIGTYIGTIDTVGTQNGDVLEPGLLNIRLDDTWASDFLKATDGRFVDDAALKQFFQGVFIKCATPSPADGQGEIFSIDLQNSFTGIHFYYHNDTDDSLKYDLVINDTEQRFSNFEQDYSGYPLEQALNDPNSAENELYIQGMAGAGVEMEFPHLDELPDLGVLLINKAELLLTLADDEDWPSITRMNMVVYNEEGSLVFIADYYDAFIWDQSRQVKNNTYRMPLTLHMQNVLSDFVNGENSNFKILLVPEGNSITAERVLLHGTNSGFNPCQLIVTYTPLN